MSFSPTAAAAAAIAGDAVIFVLLRVIFPYRSTNEWVEDKDSYVDDDDDDDDCKFYGDDAMILAMITRWWWQDDYNKDDKYNAVVFCNYYLSYWIWIAACYKSELLCCLC